MSNKLKLFSCLIVLSAHPETGAPLCTYHKDGITENELTLLRGIKGADRIKDVKEAGEIERDNREDLLMVARAYSQLGVEVLDHTGPMLVKKHLGVDLFEYSEWMTRKLEEEEGERERKFAERAAARPAVVSGAQTEAKPPETTAVDVARAALAATAAGKPAKAPASAATKETVTADID